MKHTSSQESFTPLKRKPGGYFDLSKDSLHSKTTCEPASTSNTHEVAPLFRSDPKPSVPVALPPRRRASISRYKTFPWDSSWNMYVLLAVGVFFAGGHHWFYSGLHGHEAAGAAQMQMLRYGQTLSTFAVASLSAALVIALRQRVWMAVSRRTFTLAAIDALFAATQDITSLFEPSLYREASLVMLLAWLVWAAPLVVILTSSTLTVEAPFDLTTCPAARTLNFTLEEQYNWRTAPKQDNLYRLSLSFWNATAANTSDPLLFDYYHQYPLQAETLATLVSLLGRPAEKRDESLEVCGKGWDCSYETNFIAPGYKCTELASGVGSTPAQLGLATCPFGPQDLMPEGNSTYLSTAFIGEYASQQVPSGNGGVPLSQPPWPKTLGAFRTEPVIWLGYSEVADSSARGPNSSDPDRFTHYNPRIFGCEHWEIKYSVLVEFKSSHQYYRILDRSYLRPIINTTLDSSQEANDGTLDSTVAVPEENYVYPTDARYRTIAAYHGLGVLLRRYLNGSVDYAFGSANVRTRLRTTHLLDPSTSLTPSDIMSRIQNLYEDQILSIMSEPQFLATTWAATPDRLSTRDVDTRYPCRRWREGNRFVYRWVDLVITYAIAITVAGVGVILGAQVIWRSGIVRTAKFSSILAATRSQGLSQLGWGVDDGRPPEGAGEVRIGYGMTTSRASYHGDERGFGQGMGRLTPEEKRDMFSFGLEADLRQG